MRLESPAQQIDVEDGRVVRIQHAQGIIEPRGTVSSLPLRHMVGLTSPGAPAEVQQAAQGLRYRDFMTVALVLDGKDLFPDNWIYIHEEAVRVGRIQNYRSWSPWMVPDPDTACVGLEYFAFKGDDLWMMDDDKLIDLAVRELDQLGLAKPEQVRRGYVGASRSPTPMYDEDLRRARRGDPRLAWPGRTSSRSAATACTATTTPITRCCRRCARSTTSCATRATTSGPST